MTGLCRCILRCAWAVPDVLIDGRVPSEGVRYMQGSAPPAADR